MSPGGQRAGGAGVQSVTRAFAVLRAIAAEGGSSGVSAVARRSRLPKSTVARLLATMESIGAVERVEGDADYRIGPAVRSLSGGGDVGLQHVEVARPYLRELVDQVDEDVGLGIRDGAHVLFVDQVQGSHAVQVPDWTGERFPLHTTAAGFVFLAAADDATVDRYLAGPLDAFTAATLTTPASIRERLAAVRSAGYAWTTDEWAEGVSGLAAGIRDRAGRVVAAVNLYGPSYRLATRGDRAELAELVKETATRISAHLTG